MRPDMGLMMPARPFLTRRRVERRYGNTLVALQPRCASTQHARIFRTGCKAPVIRTCVILTAVSAQNVAVMLNARLFSVELSGLRRYLVYNTYYGTGYGVRVQFSEVGPSGATVFPYPRHCGPAQLPSNAWPERF